MVLGSLAPEEKDILSRLGIDIGRILHGEQHFTHLKPIYANPKSYPVIKEITNYIEVCCAAAPSLDFQIG